MEQDSIRPEDLHGTWRLVSAIAADEGGRALPPPYGPKPMGRLALDASGRMMAVLCDGRPSMPDGEVRAYSSYCGNYTVNGLMLVTHVDAASDPSRVGSVQSRRLEMRDGRLVLLPPRRSDGAQRQLVWERVGAP